MVIGLDLEKTNRLSRAAMKRVLHANEIDFAGGDAARASLIFCLKEAFYKAQYPTWQTTANFNDLALDVDMDKSLARISYIDTCFPEDLRRLADLMAFRFRFFDDYVVSFCWIAENA